MVSKAQIDKVFAQKILASFFAIILKRSFENATRNFRCNIREKAMQTEVSKYELPDVTTLLDKPDRQLLNRIYAQRLQQRAG